ncbi:hypothetical protein F4777DRAFT_570984 [Nemania sp. FL0916]|nr:hypothetical protein F4777DRAFT_570984 [Nemania sp. FL0916]
MNAALPNKRRALAPVDANTRSALAAPRSSPSKPSLVKSKMSLETGPADPSTKRPIEQENDRNTSDSAKKPRLSSTETAPVSPQNERPLQQKVDNLLRPRSLSPEDSSMFDNLVIDSSQVTTISEPDTETATAAASPAASTGIPTVAEKRPRPRSMTREQARRTTEILRLRLGLAKYKVKTNQADVPLERLQARPIAGNLAKSASSTVLLPQLPAPSPRSTMAASQGGEQRLSSPPTIEMSTARMALAMALSPRSGETTRSASRTSIDETPTRRQEGEHIRPSTSTNTPEKALTDRDAEFSDNELGGAAEGLLSLSQSSPASMLK